MFSPEFLEMALSKHRPRSPFARDHCISLHSDTTIKREQPERTLFPRLQGQTLTRAKRKEKDLGIVMIPS